MSVPTSILDESNKSSIGIRLCRLMDPLPGESGRSDEGMVRAMSVAFKQYRGADRRAWGISDSAHAGGSVRALPGTHAQGDADPDGRPHRDGTALCVPSGWPESVSAPGTQRMESDAVGFLLDCCPPDYRAYPLLRREPVVLARFAFLSWISLFRLA